MDSKSAWQFVSLKCFSSWFFFKFFRSHSFPFHFPLVHLFSFHPLFFPSSIHWQSLWNIGTAILLPCFPVAWSGSCSWLKTQDYFFKKCCSMHIQPAPSKAVQGHSSLPWNDFGVLEKCDRRQESQRKWRSSQHAGAACTKFSNQKPSHYENCPFTLPLKGSDAHTQVCTQSVALKTIHQSFNSLKVLTVPSINSH